MAFFSLRKKKKEDFLDMQLPPQQQEMPPPQSTPLEQVLMMKQQGYTNNQIIQTLQGQGYNTDQIFEAINQAGLTGGFQAVLETQERPEAAMQDYGQKYEPQPYRQQQPSPQSHAPRDAQAAEPVDEERIQEVAEAIINEKWEEIAKDIRKIAEWKEKSEERLLKLEQQVIDLKMGMDSLTKSIMSKISSYDQNIVDVGTEIKAMEKVFQKVLPNLTENVNKLDRMTRNIKEKEAPPQKK